MNYIKKLTNAAVFVAKNISRPDVLSGIVLSVAIVAVTVSTSSVIMQNYQLAKSVRLARQKVEIAQIELDLQKLKNEYYKTDAYMDIAARRQLSRGTDGEKLVIVPRSAIQAYIPKNLSTSQPAIVASKVSKSNLVKWWRFVSGRPTD